MNGPVLTLLTAIIAALAGLGVLGTVWPGQPRPSIGYATAGLAGLASILALAGLSLPDTPATLALPLGPPGSGFNLMLDPPAAFFALLVFAAGAAASAFAAATNDSLATSYASLVATHYSPGTPRASPAASHQPLPATHPRPAANHASLAAAAQATTDDPMAAVGDPPATIAAMPFCLAGLGLAVLAADGLGRATGLALAGAAIWAMGPPNRATATQLATTLLTAASVIAAAGVVVPAATNAASAASPLAVLVAVLLGPLALAGLVPPHGWLTAACRATGTPPQAGPLSLSAPATPPLPAPAAALLSGAMAPAAIYATLRMLFDPAAAAHPTWWGLPLLLLGAVAAVGGGLAATRRGEIDTALAASTVRQTGLATIGLGIALTARAADLPDVTAMALGAVLLLAVLQAICGTLLALLAGAIRQGAGTRRLDRLGGLVHRMPVTTACLLAGLFATAALPPSSGFAAIWLLFQALLALPRAGALPFQLLLCVLAAVLGVTAALASAGLLRLVGVVCLGRPRTPRTAAADETSRPARLPLLALAATAIMSGAFVGPLLNLLADAPIRALTGTGLGPHASLLGLAPGSESPGYAALPLASLLLLAAGLVHWLRRRSGMPRGNISGPAWEGGFAAPPLWLPFGNPITQTSGAGFAPVPTWRAWPLPLRPRLRSALARSPAPALTPDPALRSNSVLPSHPALPPRPAVSPDPALPPLPTLPRSSLLPLGAPTVVLIVVAALLALCAWAGPT